LTQGGFTLKDRKNEITRRDFVKTGLAGAGALSLGLGFPAIVRGKTAPIRIGGLMDMTGGLYAFGIWGHRSTEAAVKRLNAQGGIGGREVVYIMEDSATNVQTGIRKLRKLIQQDGCDFIVAPCNSGINIASAPIVEQFATPYLAWGTALSITTDKGNRFMFRGINNIRHGMVAMAKIMGTELGKRYYCLGADYEWGRSVITEFQRVMNPMGGKMVGEEYSPVGTEDFVPYLNKIKADETDILVGGYFTADILKLSRQAYEKGLLKKMQVVGGAMPTGIAPKEFGPGGNAVWFTSYGAQRMVDVPAALKSANKIYRDAISMDDEGNDIKSGEAGSPTYSWTCWEHVSWIKRGIEKSGWKTKDDVANFIQALEGMKVEAGDEFPQGPKSMRAQDHQVFTDQYVYKIQDNQFVLKGVTEAKDLDYPSEVDYTKQKV
jgi:ABC-type branched-subunit amino acid transport system substrate-binding protein